MHRRRSQERHENTVPNQRPDVECLSCPRIPGSPGWKAISPNGDIARRPSGFAVQRRQFEESFPIGPAARALEPLPTLREGHSGSGPPAGLGPVAGAGPGSSSVRAACNSVGGLPSSWRPIAWPRAEDRALFQLRRGLPKAGIVGDSFAGARGWPNIALRRGISPNNHTPFDRRGVAFRYLASRARLGGRQLPPEAYSAACAW